MVHTLPAWSGSGIVGIALGYEDVNDHDELRADRAHDPPPPGGQSCTSATANQFRLLIPTAAYWLPPR